MQREIRLHDVPAGGRVVVAMSGGVDSSVAAALMHEAGYETIGVTLQLYDHGMAVTRPGSCCAGQDIHDARRVAEMVGIPHYVLDYESRFRQSVIDDFADTYLAGETPIPCVKCNQTVKFTDLLAMARDLGAEALVTGHYVIRKAGEDGAELHRAVDPDRDQSYFLFATTRSQLDYLRFPLGDLQKAETRAIATRLGLTVAEKPDSQDICFVPNGNYAGVIEKLRPEALDPGDIVHLDGRVLGRHDGIINFTVGQRRGLGIGGGDPLYVIRIDAPRRQVIVGPRDALRKTALLVRELNWLATPLNEGDKVRVQVKVRSTRPPVPATLEKLDGDRARIALDIAEEGVAPGQACVAYAADDGSRVLGGGWIVAGETVPH